MTPETARSGPRILPRRGIAVPRGFCDPEATSAFWRVVSERPSAADGGIRLDVVLREGDRVELPGHFLRAAASVTVTRTPGAATTHVSIALPTVPAAPSDALYEAAARVEAFMRSGAWAEWILTPC